MTTVDLSNEQTSREEIFRLAERQSLLVRTAEGKLFLVTEVAADNAGDDFSDEIVRTQGNRELREMLAERSREAGLYNLEQARQKLGLER